MVLFIVSICCSPHIVKVPQSEMMRVCIFRLGGNNVPGAADTEATFVSSKASD